MNNCKLANKIIAIIIITIPYPNVVFFRLKASESVKQIPTRCMIQLCAGGAHRSLHQSISPYVKRASSAFTMYHFFYNF